MDSSGLLGLFQIQWWQTPMEASYGSVWPSESTKVHQERAGDQWLPMPSGAGQRRSRAFPLPRILLGSRRNVMPRTASARQAYFSAADSCAGANGALCTRSIRTSSDLYFSFRF
ncbi:hypothetical protein FB451DRAFT_1183858 [Mycena latifolia]|nr:hypothetical protein FB451DRAFT_1183858 [Mycena latifolia]